MQLQLPLQPLPTPPRTTTSAAAAAAAATPATMPAPTSPWQQMDAETQAAARHVLARLIARMLADEPSKEADDD